MSRTSPRRDDHESTASPELTRVIFLAMGIAAVIGLICGFVWLGYQFVRNWFE
jgi:hypothetical protein